MTGELSENMEILFDQNLTWENYSLMGVKLNDDVANIPFESVKDTTMERFQRE